MKEGPWHASTKYLLYLRPFSCLSKWLQWPLNTQERFVLNFILKQRDCCLFHNPKPQRNYLHKVLEIRKSKLVLSKKNTDSSQKHTWGRFSKIILWVGIFFKSANGQNFHVNWTKWNLQGDFLGSTKIKYTS